jgi:hypothetical protein
VIVNREASIVNGSGTEIIIREGIEKRDEYRSVLNSKKQNPNSKVSKSRNPAIATFRFLNSKNKFQDPKHLVFS